MIVDKKAVNEEYNNVINEILQWYYKKIKTLSIVSPPYNDISIFIDIILEVLQDKKIRFCTYGMVRKVINLY